MIKLYDLHRPTCGFESLSGLYFYTSTSARYVSDTSNVIQGTSSGTKGCFGRFRNMDPSLSLDDAVSNVVTTQNRNDAQWTAGTDFSPSRVLSVCSVLGNQAWNNAPNAFQRSAKLRLTSSDISLGVLSYWVAYSDGGYVRGLYDVGGNFGYFDDDFGGNGPSVATSWRRKFVFFDISSLGYIDFWPVAGLGQDRVMMSLGVYQRTDFICANSLLAEPSLGTVAAGKLAHSGTPMSGTRVDCWIKFQPKNPTSLLGNRYLMFVDANNYISHNFTTEITTFRVGGVNWMINDSIGQSDPTFVDGGLSHLPTYDLHFAYGGGQQSVFQCVIDGVPGRERRSGSPQTAHSSSLDLQFLGRDGVANSTIGSYVHSIRFEV